MLVVWSSETHQAYHGDEVEVHVGDLGLNTYWPSFVALSEAFGLTST
jgi:hypothetical protein